jgi:hypothetical protein
MRRLLRAALTSATLALMGAPVATIGCGPDVVGVEACRKIETERCKWAPACGIDLDIPTRRDKEASAVDDCIRHYHDACAHGLVSNDPGEAAVGACVQTIKDPTGRTQAEHCAIVRAPELAPACAWLLIPRTPQDAGSDAADDGPGDGSADAPDG